MRKGYGMNKNKLMIKYCILQGCYWALFCAVYGFATVYLLERGFAGTHIGVILALGNVLGVVLQPVFAGIADASERITVQRLTCILSGGMLFTLLMQLAVQNIFVTALLFILANALLQVLQPMVNSVSVYYINRGMDLNFGVARGIGSGSYAVISSVLGALIADRGSAVILYTGCILLAVMMILLIMMPVLADTADETAASQKRTDKKERNVGGFLSRYSYFVFVLLGLTLLMVEHNLVTNYMIQIVTFLGGDSGNMGTALSIAALVELPTMFGFSILVRKISSSRLLAVSGVFFFAKAVGHLLCGNMMQMYFVQILQMGAFALYIPASVYYVNQVMEPQDKFKGQALMAGTSTLGGVFGGLLGGVLVDYTGVQVLLICGAVIAFAGMVLVTCFAPKVKKAEDISA
ncbi:MAG: MFS transporter [Eubacteriales bacterium]|nr:MFS transporter [Eubacteriales bacterium]